MTTTKQQNNKTLPIVKRHGTKEGYDDRKVYASVYSAALNCHYGEKKAETIAHDMTKIIL